MVKRVLHYVGQMDIGGIESLLMSIYRNINKSEYQFDFAVHTQKKCFYDDEIEDLGGTFYRFPMMRKDPGKYRDAWDDFWDKHKNDYIAFHFHTPTFANIIAMISAKKYGVPVIIAHCHNIHSNKGRWQLIHDIIHKYHGKHIERYADVFCACSEDAAKWGFGKQYEQGKLEVEILKNGIDLSNFRFSSTVREYVRHNLGIEDRFVIGNVGRLCKQKNQLFLLDIIKEVKKEKENAILMLIGTGPDEQVLREKVDSLGLTDSVMFLGARSDVPELMMAMDYYAFPSIHEGLGIVMIEAQAIGLPIVASKDRVPNEAKVTDYVTFLDLEKGAEAWAREICDNNKMPFKNTHSQIAERGYDIKDTVMRYTCLLKKH